MDMFTVIGPDGESDLIYADDMAKAYEMAVERYGRGAVIRPTWYGEWECGSGPESACHYDRYGKHHVRDGITCTECGNSFRADQINDHGNGERFCEVCQ